MNTKETRHTMNLSGKELKFIMFGKKKCPLCGAKLCGTTQKDYKGEQIVTPFGVDDGGIQLIKQKADVYEHKKIYICPDCIKAFALEDLIKSE